MPLHHLREGDVRIQSNVSKYDTLVRSCPFRIQQVSADEGREFMEGCSTFPDRRTKDVVLLVCLGLQQSNTELQHLLIPCQALTNSKWMCTRL